MTQQPLSEQITRRIQILQSADAALRTVVAGLDPATVSRPSLLPDWSVGHVVSHLSRNADGLRNLLIWARSGVETPMYSSIESRDADIESGARRPAAEILADFPASSDLLNAEIAALSPAAWSAPVRTRTGGPIPAAVVLDHRICELFLHHHDLGVDDRLSALSDQQATELLSVLHRTYVRTHQVPSITLQPSSGPAVVLGPADPAAPVIAGSPAALAGWLTGRTDGRELSCDGPLPALPPW